MFCVQITFWQYFKNVKQGLFAPPPPVTSVGGAKQPPSLMSLKYCKMLLVHKTSLYILGYIIYIFVRGVDALKANLLKKALF